MPYAAKNRIAQDVFEGAIEITALEYAEALDGLCNGLEVIVEGGFHVRPRPDPQVPVDPVVAPETIE
ncbi:hypothetical protein ACW9H6_04120 [Pseudomonas sp. SDO528_S397]